MDIVEWCNENVGFTNAILSIITILISVIAIVISIKMAYVPYKKKIIIRPEFGIDKDKSYYVELTIVNSGNKLIGINSITISYKNEFVGATGEKRYIEPSKIEKYYIKTEVKQIDIKIENNPIIGIRIKDTENKEYQFKEEIAWHRKLV